ncbi:unnamed protein product [Dibothriocephalus latus]|uniref:MBTPS1 fourth domain-containing protein n=1 Tax=Dibothriocephalus latus TaxID=60516 RepID=A0A3P7P079_DIBLA|nr:unnamed protein product [Dibothriocephalus latus]
MALTNMRAYTLSRWGSTGGIYWMVKPSRKFSTELKLPIRVRVVPTPERRLGDHIHTNFRDLYNHLRGEGYYLEVLQQPFTCFDAGNYGTLMLVDPEEEFFPAEIAKLRRDILQQGLSLLVFAGWYNTTIQDLLRFYDSHTRRLWSPPTGGTNVPALNDLLAPLGIQFGDTVLSGDFSLGNKSGECLIPAIAIFQWDILSTLYTHTYYLLVLASRSFMYFERRMRRFAFQLFVRVGGKIGRAAAKRRQFSGVQAYKL